MACSVRAFYLALLATFDALLVTCHLSNSLVHGALEALAHAWLATRLAELRFAVAVALARPEPDATVLVRGAADRVGGRGVTRDAGRAKAASRVGRRRAVVGTLAAQVGVATAAEVAATLKVAAAVEVAPAVEVVAGVDVAAAVQAAAELVVAAKVSGAQGVFAAAAAGAELVAVLVERRSEALSVGGIRSAAVGRA
jgi:hypothetical protein